MLTTKYQNKISEYIFPSPITGKPLKSIRTEFSKLLKKLNIDLDKSIHSFCHALVAN